MGRAKILLVEDDNLLAESLAKYLKLNGYDVDIAKSYSEAGDKTFNHKYDLYIFDINLKDGNGIQLLEDLRFAEDDTPTIFISALRDGKTVVKGFNAGAEDYIKKPFDPEELLVRVKVRLESKRQTPEEELSYGDIRISGGRVYKDEKPVDLSPLQIKFLEKLVKNRGKIVPKERFFEIMEHPSDLALRVTISKIKKKTGLEIKSVRGLGYTLE
ncbi:DNA-binding response regulator, OmpR family, contains REC and winged-helix (wHTH) domain [Persephonella hydrogeniphila]|uniref:DNA-binding response regulator, OmpR family, contains REC and winged-helix (WHTH) domain n=1 Tax=Persephonella hydrogeniphila TaxID=198703 RepID=A0A285NJA4_9AQUI|nr:response regulator transcription factor [Persephonella hydrogeniphila]SNZ09594.1 DNA-binding response regulator, OmpR family, contains REC and winged-helix (wHTH) domain [Persephonella hydrogeniphila]